MNDFDHMSQPSAKKNLYKRTLSALKPYWRHLAAAMSLSSLHALSSAMLVWLMGPLLTTLFNTESPIAALGVTVPPIDAAPGNGAVGFFGGLVASAKAFVHDLINSLIVTQSREDTLVNFCIAIVLIVFLVNLFSYFQGFFMAYVQQSLMKSFRDQLFAKYQRLSLDFFHKRRTGHLISRVTNDVVVLNDAVEIAFNRVITDTILVLLFISFLLILSWKLTLLTLLILPPCVYFIWLLGRKLRRYSERAQHRMADVNSVLEEAVSNVRIVKAFSMESFETKKFLSATSAYFRSLLKIARVRNLASPVSDVIASLAGAGIVYYAGSRLIGGTGTMTAGDFITYIIAMFALIKPAKSLSQVHVRLQEGMAAAERIYEVLDAEEKIVDKPSAKSIDSFTDRITYEHVSFRYIPNEAVLDDISFAISRGEVIAIVGPSGAGKSTLVDLLPRFYDPQQGRISIDGVDLRDLKVTSIRKLMGIVTQETYLFHDTIRNNIAYGLEGISESRLKAASEAANAHQFISQLELGYNTVVGNRGVRLSGGQRQRIAIARALLKDPQILIFDEATSSLDTESEALVQEAIDRLMANRTALVIAHRLSTIRNADKILVLDKGKLVEQGTHESLLRTSGTYSRLHHLQFRSDPTAERAEVGS